MFNYFQTDRLKVIQKKVKVFACLANQSVLVWLMKGLQRK